MVYNDPVTHRKEKQMKSLVKIVINGLALVGVHEIYKEYTSRKKFENALAGLTNDVKTPNVKTFPR